MPSCVQNASHPIVSFKYAKTIAGRILNQKRVVEELDVNVGTSNMSCYCHTSKYYYSPAGHVVTVTADLK